MLLWIAVLLPLLGAVINGFFLRKAPKIAAHVTGSLVMLASFACTVVLYTQFMQAGGQEPVIYRGFEWLKAGGFQAPYELVFDRLSGFMMLIVTGIGSLIHIYAGGYMHEEEKTYRFFAYLNLFVFMMLQLVLGENLMVMFVGWEGVGLCSYLLIGYWFSDSANAAAGMKAFLVNRIGDIGFLLGVFLLYKLFGTVSFSTLKTVIVGGEFDFPHYMLSIVTVCLFIAACGKSAQIPLYVWLPDAMAGPTPVSALIHAATMVTAGIYMMCRLNFLFFSTPEVMQFIAIVGAATALFAASIALVQNDIKKVLAYSTVSQLGYMVMACGVGAFGVGFFHVFTHACFKALLFMGAGSVIVAMHHEQDMRNMGGLRKYLPITHVVMLIGVLAIIGFPGLAGFFSKDEILWHAYLAGGYPLWGVGVLTASFTAFYMVRLLCLTFYGPNRSDEHTRHHLHETPAHMWGPLVILAILSVFAGYLGVPEFIFGEGTNVLHHYFHGHVIVIPEKVAQTWAFLEEHHSHAIEWALMGASTSVVLLAAGLAVVMYRSGPSAAAERLAKRFSKVYDLLLNKYWIDELYAKVFVQPLKDMSAFLYRVFDVLIVDGMVNGFAQACNLIAAVTSFRMSGSLHRHGMVIMLGILCLIAVLIVQ